MINPPWVRTWYCINGIPPRPQLTVESPAVSYPRRQLQKHPGLHHLILHSNHIILCSRPSKGDLDHDRRQPRYHELTDFSAPSTCRSNHWPLSSSTSAIYHFTSDHLSIPSAPALTQEATNHHATIRVRRQSHLVDTQRSRTTPWFSRHLPRKRAHSSAIAVRPS